VSYVKDACAFLGPGMSRIEKLEEKVHGKARNAETDELRLGVLYTSDTKDILREEETTGREGAVDWDRDVGRVGDVEDEDGGLRRRGWFR